MRKQTKTHAELLTRTRIYLQTHAHSHTHIRTYLRTSRGLRSRTLPAAKQTSSSAEELDEGPLPHPPVRQPLPITPITPHVVEERYESTEEITEVYHQLQANVSETDDSDIFDDSNAETYVHMEREIERE